MKVWMVLALLAMGLGCSEEPPEQWSSAFRVLVVEACIDDHEDGADAGLVRRMRHAGLVRRMAAEGITIRDLCRCAQNELERRYTWSDLDLFWTGGTGTQAPATKARGAVAFMDATDYATSESILEIGCREEMLD